MVMRLVVMGRPMMMARRPVMMRVMATPAGPFEILLHHRSAVLVPHDLLVGHAVALPNCPFRKVLMSGVVMRLASVRFPVAMRRAVAMRGAVVV